jgi:hypothetical protein
MFLQRAYWPTGRLYAPYAVIHHVQLSLFPNWVGVDQERLVDVTANRLTLSTRPTLFDGIQQTARVVWERA